MDYLIKISIFSLRLVVVMDYRISILVVVIPICKLKMYNVKLKVLTTFLFYQEILIVLLLFKIISSVLCGVVKQYINYLPIFYINHGYRF